MGHSHQLKLLLHYSRVLDPFLLDSGNSRSAFGSSFSNPLLAILHSYLFLKLDLITSCFHSFFYVGLNILEFF